MSLTPLIEELPAALCSEEAFQRLASRPYAVFLDSSDAEHGTHRYSIIATDPLCIENSWQVLSRDGPVWPPVHEPSAPFCGGWIGYLAYEAYQLFVPQVEERPTRHPLMSFGFYDTWITFDHCGKRAWISSLGLENPGADSDETLARERIEELKQMIETGSRRGEPVCSPGPTHRSAPTTLIPSVSKDTYREHIATIQDYLRAGDCYQVNYTQSWRGKTHLSAAQLYTQLRRASPAPLAAYLNWGDFQILSASPESFLEIDAGKVRTCPIKGTRPRSPEPTQDKRMRTALFESAKDRAELLMITDLERNDLGKVCVPGSVETKTLLEVQDLAQVYHLYSVIEGTLRPEYSSWDVLAACFPGGSITGAPKIRAMQIIRELETHPREVYTGAIGYIDLNGRSRFNIPIRSLLYEAGELSLYAGGGIVADSDAESEFDEAWLKTKGIREALTV